MTIIGDDLIFQTFLSQHEYPSLSVAISLGLFEKLETGPKSKDSLQKLLKLGPRGLQALLDVLTSSGYLSFSREHYHLSEISRAYLVQGKISYWGPMLSYNSLHERMIGAFESEVKEQDVGSISCRSWESACMPKELAISCNAAMQSHSFVRAVYLANNFDFARLGVSSLLDIGGGSGCFSIEINKSQPAVKTIVFDLKTVCEDVEQKYIPSSNALGVSTISGNMFDNNPFPITDGHFYSNIIHDWSVGQSKFLLEKSFSSLPKNGFLFLHEALLKDDGTAYNGTNAKLTALFSMHMFMFTKGFQWREKELMSFLAQIGFVDINIVPASSMYSLVIARKP